ncbi:MAG: ATP-binding protein [Steroidobacteraceae bacterium]
MARSDLLLNLVKAGSAGDGPMFKRTVDAIVAEERAKQHNVLAEQIERAVVPPKTNGHHSAPAVPVEPSHRARDFVLELTPRRRIDELVLPQLTALAARQLIEEQQRASLLRSHSLEPRNRLLLVGPPGNGKTTLAEAIAESLAVPFFVVRYESVIGSYLGETAARLRRVFEFAKTTPCVLFFDEFDTVGKERGDTHETGEIKRVVSSLLMQIDDLPSYVVVIAATNHAELLDRAVWRRFQLRLDLPLPTQKQLGEFIASLARQSDIDLGISATQVARAIGRVSYSEAEEFFLDLARQQVLSLGARTPATIAKEQTKIWSARIQNKNANKSGAKRAGSSST